MKGWTFSNATKTLEPIKLGITATGQYDQENFLNGITIAAEQVSENLIPDNWDFSKWNGPAESCAGKQKKHLPGLYILDNKLYCEEK